MITNTQQLPGTVQNAAPNLLGFDTDTVVSASQAAYFKSKGYSFCIRYLSRNSPQQSGDLCFNEANDILNSGLALSAIQHVSSPGWIPTRRLGTTYGKNAASNAQSLGLPLGMNIWCDLEGVASGTSPNDIIAYCNEWYDAVCNVGYIPGIYVGANCVLTGEELYDNLLFAHYWQSLSNVPAIPTRGYQLVQSLEEDLIDGLSIDNDTTQNDELGNSMIWLKI
jgi:hypothetical protein